ncbi:MAG: autotransporter domain-containing protein [Deltaproteobacteria bacterium]|nr:autotransporter domain-containing protein [Deltaproteobacteria bacterium]
MIIDNGTVHRDVYGGNSQNGIAFNNTVKITDAKVGQHAWAGVGASASNNTIIFTNSNISGNSGDGDVIGGKADGVDGDVNARVYAENNSVTINGSSNITGNRSEVSGGVLSSGRSPQNGSVRFNEVIIDNEGGFIGDHSQPNQYHSEDGVVAGGQAGHNTNGTISDNKVTYKGGSAKIVAGGYALDNFTGDVASNNVTVTGGNITEAIFGGSTGANSEGGNVHHNVVHFSGADAVNIYGGYAGSNSVANVINNLVNITGGNVTGEVYGGYATLGQANNNIVEISNTLKSIDYVCGGHSDSGDASSNQVNLTGVNVSYVIGGSSGSGHASNNQVTLTGMNVSSVYGGLSGPGNASNNQVNLTGVNVLGDVVGGCSNIAFGNASNNQVTLSGVNVSSVYGGWSNTALGDASNNQVTLSGVNVSYNVYGGYSHNGHALNNQVTLSGVNVTGKVYGGSAAYNASNNQVTLSEVIVSYVYGGRSEGSGEVSNNQVTLNGVNVSYDVYGGLSGYGDALNNKVNLTGVNASSVYGGYSGGSGNASNNQVNLSGVNVTNVYGGHSSSGNASNNQVTLSGVNVSKNVYGGFSSSGNASNNLVILSGVNVSGNVTGGYSGSTTNNNHNRVILRGANISGSILGDNGANNSVVFEAGSVPNYVNGTVNISGELLIAGGENTVNQTADLGNLSVTGGDTLFKNGAIVNNSVAISGGVTEFQNDLSVTLGEVLISGGENTFANVKVLGAGQNLTITGGLTEFKGDLNLIGGDVKVTGGNNTFNYINTLGNISISGVKTTYAGNISANKFTLGGGEHYFNSTTDQLIFTSQGVEVDNSQLYFGAGGGDIIFQKSLILNSPSSINLVSDANLTITDAAGLELGGILDVGLHELQVKGNVTFYNASTFRFDTNSTAQGLLHIVGDLNINSTNEVARIEAKNPDEVSLGSKIIEIDTSAGALNLNPEENFNSDLFTIVSDNSVSGLIAININGYKDAGQIISQGGTDLDSSTHNQKEFLSLSDHIVKDISNGLGGPELIILAAQVNKRIADAVKTGDKGVLNRVLKEITGEYILGVSQGVAETTVKVQGVVFKRLDQIHESLNSAAPAAGAADAFNRAWVGGFGSWARQKDRDGIDGYDYNAGGFSLGYDRRAEGFPGLRFGIVTSFSFGKIESNDGFSTVDTDTAGVGIYGSYLLDNGFFFDANVAYSHSKNDSKILTWNGGYKTGDFDIDTWQFGARVGKIFDFGNLKFTPSVGLRYISVQQDAFAERVVNSQATANYFDKKTDHIVEIPILLKLNGSFETGSGKITPEFRAGYTFVAQKPGRSLRDGLINSNGWQHNRRMNPEGIKPARGSAQVGVGLKYDISDRVDIFVNYDLDASSKFISHNAALGLGFNF